MVGETVSAGGTPPPGFDGGDEGPVTGTVASPPPHAASNMERDADQRTRWDTRIKERLTANTTKTLHWVEPDSLRFQTGIRITSR